MNNKLNIHPDQGKESRRTSYVMSKSKYVIPGLILLFVMIILSSFLLRTRYLDEKGLQEYVLNNENGLSKEEIIGDVSLKVYYKPSGLIALQEMKAMKNMNKDSAFGKYDSQYYFILSISKQNNELESFYVRQGNFSQKVEQMAFGMGKFIRIVTSEKDTIGLKGYTYPRMYGATGSSSFIFIFDNKKIKEADWFDLEFEYPDLGIFSKKFRFETSSIEAVPDPKID